MQEAERKRQCGERDPAESQRRTVRLLQTLPPALVQTVNTRSAQAYQDPTYISGIWGHLSFNTEMIFTAEQILQRKIKNEGK